MELCFSLFQEVCSFGIPEDSTGRTEDVHNNGKPWLENGRHGFPEPRLSSLRTCSVTCDSTFDIFLVLWAFSIICNQVDLMLAPQRPTFQDSGLQIHLLLWTFSFLLARGTGLPALRGWWPLGDSQPALPSQASSIKCGLTFSKTASSWFWLWEPSFFLYRFLLVGTIQTICGHPPLESPLCVPGSSHPGAPHQESQHFLEFLSRFGYTLAKETPFPFCLSTVVLPNILLTVLEVRWHPGTDNEWNHEAVFIDAPIKAISTSFCNFTMTLRFVKWISTHLTLLIVTPAFEIQTVKYFEHVVTYSIYCVCVSGSPPNSENVTCIPYILSIRIHN